VGEPPGPCAVSGKHGGSGPGGRVPRPLPCRELGEELWGEPRAFCTGLRGAVPVAAGWAGSSSRPSAAAAGRWAGSAAPGGPAGLPSVGCRAPAAAACAGLAPRRAALGAGCVRGRVGRCWGWQEPAGASVPWGRETPRGLCWGGAQHPRVGAVPLVGGWSVGVQPMGTRAALGGFWGETQSSGPCRALGLRAGWAAAASLPGRPGAPCAPHRAARPVLTLPSASSERWLPAAASSSCSCPGW